MFYYKCVVQNCCKCYSAIKNPNCAIITDCSYKDPRSDSGVKQQQLNEKDRATKQASNLGPEATFLFTAVTGWMIMPKETKGKKGLNAKDRVQLTRNKSAVKHQ